MKNSFKAAFTLLTCLSVLGGCGTLDSPDVKLPQETDVPTTGTTLPDIYGFVKLDYKLPDSIYQSLKPDQFLCQENGHFYHFSRYDYCYSIEADYNDYVKLPVGDYKVDIYLSKRSLRFNSSRRFETYYVSSEYFTVTENDTVIPKYKPMQINVLIGPEWYEE